MCRQRSVGCRSLAENLRRTLEGRECVTYTPQVGPPRAHCTVFFCSPRACLPACPVGGVSCSQWAARRRQQRCVAPLQREFLGIIGTGDGGAVASRGALALEGDYLWDLKAMG